jgi:hypothetical protein
MTDSIRPNNLDLIDGLRRFQDQFELDFSIDDIKSGILNTKILSKNAFMEITQLPDEQQRIEQLFFIFIYVKKDVTPLLQLLKTSYKWLYDAILKSKSDKWISDYRQAIIDVPNNQDWNIHRTDFLWKIQQHLKTLQRGQYLILFGKLGIGKRWLAA